MTLLGRKAGVPHRGFITVSVMLATIMQALDTTIANVALPNMQGSLSATQDQISWVLTSYIVAAAIMTPPTGFFESRFGRKRLFLLSIAGFTIASMLCGAATSLEEMVLFRLLQGMFGAALVPLSQTVLLDAYPHEQHGQAMAVWGMGIMVGPILGPTLGGYLTEFYSWRWVFYINFPVGILAFLGVMAFVAETKTRKVRFDVLGFTFLSLGIGAMQMFLDRGELKDWFGSTEVMIECALGVFGFYAFTVHMFTTDNPFLSPAIFKDRNFVTGLLFIFIVGIILLATLALLPPFLQGLMGYPVLTTGYVLAPRGIGTLIAMTIVGRAITRVDPRLLILAGFLLAALSLYQMSGFSLDVSMSALIWSGFIQGLGLGFIFVPLTTIAFATLEPRFRTEAAGLYSLVRNIGSSIGISVVVFLLARFTQQNHMAMAALVSPLNQIFRSSHLPALWSLNSTPTLMALDAAIDVQAATIAYLNDFRLMMYVMLLAVPMLLIMRRPQRKAASGAAQIAME
jgi:MFS transporter, DHA2 family, multidrug resistance protein